MWNVDKEASQRIDLVIHFDPLWLLDPIFLLKDPKETAEIWCNHHYCGVFRHRRPTYVSQHALVDYVSDVAR